MEKKVYTIEKFVELVTAPIEKVQLPLILAGHNKMELNSKSEQELRQMVLDYVTVNEDEFFEVLAHGNLETTVGLQKAIIQLGLPIEELYKKLGFNVELLKEEGKESSEKENFDNREQYLFHTEDLFEQAVNEFLSSKLSNQERVFRYMDRVNDIDQQFRKLTRTTPGFVGSERWKEAQEFLRTIPRVEMYKQDDKVGDYINMARAKGYYDDLARQLEGGWGIGGNGNAPKSL